MKRIYLDHAATTPPSPEVVEAMLGCLTDHWGNASSVHAMGRRARHALEEARERVAIAIGAQPGEIVFTSGGTEADNHALSGSTAGANGKSGVITSAVEHDAVLQPAKHLAASGCEVIILDPDSHGIVEAAAVSSAITPQTRLVSLMLVNNELGSINPVPEIAAVCRERGVLLHTDAVQAPAVMELDVERLGVDLMTLSGHKIYGPKGTGVLYVRSGTNLQPLLRGGGQERGRRVGTENLAGIVGTAVALESAASQATQEAARLAPLRDRLLERLQESLGDVMRVNTPVVRAAPHILNLSFTPSDGRPIDGEMLLLSLDMAGVMASAGSACASGALEPSHVLSAIGLDRETAAATLRLSLGRSTDEEAIDRAAGVITEAVRRQTGRGVRAVEAG